MQVKERSRASRARIARPTGSTAARPPVSAPPSAKTASVFWHVGALLILTLIAWSDSFLAGFVLDNRGLILNDARIREATASNIGLILNHTYWWPNGESGLYRPFTTLSYLFNYAILGNGARPAGYHAINFVLHLTGVLIAYLLIRRLSRRAWPAFFAAGVWAVHPVLTEAVTNVVGRADLLAGVSILAGLLLYAAATDRAHPAAFAALMAVTAAGVFSKETAVVLIAAIPLYEFSFRRKWDRTFAIGMAAVTVAILLMLWQRHAVLAGTKPMEIPFTDNPIAWADFWTGRLTALKVVAHEFGLIVWPATLSADYSWSQIPLFHGSAAEWMAVIGALAVLPFTALLWFRNRVAFFFFALGLLWIAPAANLLFPTGTIMAERLLYLPALGVSVCVVFAVYGVSARYPKLAPAVLCAIVAALAARAWVRNLDWKDDVSMAESLVRSSPNSFKTHDYLANALFAADSSHANMDRVMAESEKSRAILAPLPIQRKPADPYLFAANGYMLERDYTKAIAPLLTYKAIRPNDVEAQLLLSTAYLETGGLAKASAAAHTAREIAPLDPRVYAQLAETDGAAGRLNDAGVSLIEGAFITGDKTLRSDLVELYRRATGPGSCALTAGPGGPAINPACPVVHEQACMASGYVVRTLASAGQADLAAERRRMFAEQFKCGP